MKDKPFKPSLFTSGGKEYQFFSIQKVCSDYKIDPGKIPYSIRILLEAAIRKCDGKSISIRDVKKLAAWDPFESVRQPIAFFPARVVLQDFTGVPVMVDLAAMRTEVERRGGDPETINPSIPVDLVIDHSIQMDFSGMPDAMRKNVEKEYQRNTERYQFLRWAQKAFKNLRIVPPSSGIVHQVNLEKLSPVLQTTGGEIPLTFPDSVLGTDSHTPMINGLGVLGWGVGGIEAIAAMLNQPVEIPTPEVVGIHLTGNLTQGVTPTDLTLYLTQIIRSVGVVNKFLEYYGPGLDSLSLADRAMIANMTPENGATVSYFPVDSLTLDYLRMTGRSEEQIALIEQYFLSQGLFRTRQASEPVFSSVIEFNLSDVKPTVAGPKRPQDRISLSELKSAFHTSLIQPRSERGFQLPADQLKRQATIDLADGMKTTIRHGSVVLAAITSCTNTSNPQVMLTAGLLARNAVKAGLRVSKVVKTSLTPGSRVVAEYLRLSGLQESLDQLGFQVAGFGCATCIGNSGPLPAEIASVIKDEDIVSVAVLSGNRNFEGRVSPSTLANYLASPPLVVAFALAGRVDIDFDLEPVGTGKDGNLVYLKDIWPKQEEVTRLISMNVTPELFIKAYKDIFEGDSNWKALSAAEGSSYEWDTKSTYIQEPPYFTQLKPVDFEKEARILAIFGNSVTTDHISPAGNIAIKSPAGDYLKENGVSTHDFNSYGSRRGNDQVMVRGTFANVRLRNLMAGEIEGGYTAYQPGGEIIPIFEAASRYSKTDIPLVVLAGKEYGTGSSRDWAAKGPRLLGVQVVVAETFERIHRSNLAGMGILPLQFLPGENANTLGIVGDERLRISIKDTDLTPGCEITIDMIKTNGKMFPFKARCRLDSDLEVEYFRLGGLLPGVLSTL